MLTFIESNSHPSLLTGNQVKTRKCFLFDLWYWYFVHNSASRHFHCTGHLSWIQRSQESAKSTPLLNIKTKKENSLSVLTWTKHLTWSAPKTNSKNLRLQQCAGWSVRSSAHTQVHKYFGTISVQDPSLNYAMCAYRHHRLHRNILECTGSSGSWPPPPAR